MTLQKKTIVLLFVLGMSVSARSQAFDWYGSDKKDKPAEPAAQSKTENKKAEAPAAATQQKPAPAADSKALNLSALNNRMANNKSMTDAEKAELCSVALQHFAPGADLRSKESEKDMLAFEQIVNDPNMKVAEKKSALEKYFSGASQEPPAAVKTEPKVVPAPKVVVAAPKVAVPAPKVAVSAPKVAVPAPRVAVPAPRVAVPAPKAAVATAVVPVKVEAPPAPVVEAIETEEIKEVAKIEAPKVKTESAEPKTVKKSSNNFAQKR